jgi:hypothetical protein
MYKIVKKILSVDLSGYLKFCWFGNLKIWPTGKTLRVLMPDTDPGKIFWLRCLQFQLTGKLLLVWVSESSVNCVTFAGMGG